MCENKNVTFEEDKTFNEISYDIFREKVFLLIKKDKIALAINTEKILLVEEIKSISIKL